MTASSPKPLIELVLRGHGVELAKYVQERRADDEPWDRIAADLGGYGVEVSRWTLARWFPDDEADVA